MTYQCVELVLLGKSRYQQGISLALLPVSEMNVVLSYNKKMLTRNC